MKRLSRKLAVILSLALMVGMLAACGSNSSSGTANNTQPSGGNQTSGDAQPAGETTTYPKMNLTLTAAGAENTENGKMVKLMAEAITEASGGAITFTEYYNGTLCAPKAQLETIGSGVAQIGGVITMHTASDLPLSQIAYCAPFASPDPAFAGEVFNKLMANNPEIVEEYHKMGVHPLFIKSTQSYDILSKEPITDISALNGMKVFGGGVYFTPWFQSAGAAFVSGSVTDVYQSLKTNVVEASYLFPANWSLYKHYEVAKNWNSYNMGARANEVLCINLDTWNSFDDATKELFETVGQEVFDEYNQWLNDSAVEWEKTLLDNGVTKHEISDEVKKEWLDKIFSTTDTLQMWIDTVTNEYGYDGKAIMADYLTIAEDMGYEWLFDTSKYK